MDQENRVEKVNIPLELKEINERLNSLVKKLFDIVESNGDTQDKAQTVSSVISELWRYKYHFAELSLLTVDRLNKLRDKYLQDNDEEIFLDEISRLMYGLNY